MILRAIPWPSFNSSTRIHGLFTVPQLRLSCPGSQKSAPHQAPQFISPPIPRLFTVPRTLLLMPWLSHKCCSTAASCFSAWPATQARCQVGCWRGQLASLPLRPLRRRGRPTKTSVLVPPTKRSWDDASPSNAVYCAVVPPCPASPRYTRLLPTSSLSCAASLPRLAQVLPVPGPEPPVDSGLQRPPQCPWLSLPSNCQPRRHSFHCGHDAPLASWGSSSCDAPRRRARTSTSSL